MRYVLLLGRALFSLIFLLCPLGHFSKEAIAHSANQGVPFAVFLVPFSGILCFLGGLSILLGYKAKVGAWLIALFLVPVTFMMHDFWNQEGVMRMQDQAHFMKNIALLGAALMIAYFGSGTLSVDKHHD